MQTMDIGCAGQDGVRDSVSPIRVQNFVDDREIGLRKLNETK
jgi:hypothetical protein